MIAIYGQDLQDCSGLISIHKILNNPVNPVHFLRRKNAFKTPVAQMRFGCADDGLDVILDFGCGA
jgi:hypothetical protein